MGKNAESGCLPEIEVGDYTYVVTDADCQQQLPYAICEKEWGGTDRKIAAECKGANTLTGKGLAIQGKIAQENQASAKKSVEKWLEGLGIK